MFSLETQNDFLGPEDQEIMHWHEGTEVAEDEEPIIVSPKKSFWKKIVLKFSPKKSRRYRA